MQMAFRSIRSNEYRVMINACYIGAEILIKYHYTIK